MVGMVELWESGCYGAESLWKGLLFGGMVTLSVSEGKVYEGYIEHVELEELFNVLLIRWYY